MSDPSGPRVGGWATDTFGSLKEIAITCPIKGLPKELEHDLEFKLDYKIQIRSCDGPPDDDSSFSLDKSVLDTASRAALEHCERALGQPLTVAAWRVDKSASVPGRPAAGGVGEADDPPSRHRKRVLSDPAQWPGAINVDDSLAPERPAAEPAPSPASTQGADEAEAVAQFKPSDPQDPEYMGPNERIGHDEAPTSEPGEAPAAVEEADQGKLVADAAGNLSHRLRALSDLGVLAGGAVSLSGVADQLQKTAEALNTSAPSSGLVKDRLAGYIPTSMRVGWPSRGRGWPSR